MYRSSSSSKDRFCDKLIKLIDSTRESIILGDFNICGQREKSCTIVKSLSCYGYTQLVKEATHIRGRHIDHAYWRNINNTWLDPAIDRYSPYYSDHDAIGNLKIEIVTENFVKLI